MPAPLDCPRFDSWKALFSDAMPADQRERYERPLESCPGRQERLDRAEEGGSALLLLARKAGDPTAVAADPTLVQVLERLLQVKSPIRSVPVEPADLYFLRPADRPDLLQPETIRAPEFQTRQQGDREIRRQGDKETGRQRKRRFLVSLSPLLLVCFLLAALGLGIAGWAGGAGGPSQQTDKDANVFRQDFRGHEINEKFLSFVGPDAWEHCKREAQGLRISLPANRKPPWPVGVKALFPVKGDCEITMSYELLRADKPADGYGVGATIYIVTDPPTKEAAVLGRLNRPEGSQYVCDHNKTNAAGQRQYKRNGFPSEVRSGKLRLVRRDAILSYQVMDGGTDQFRELKQVEFTTKDLTEVRVAADSGNSGTPVEVRILDFEIRAAGLPTNAAPQVGGKTWLVIALVFLLLLTVSLGGILYVRQRRIPGKTPEPTSDQDKPAHHEAASRPAVFSCQTCGKVLKARAELAGKKVKCPQCGKPSLVPVPETFPAPSGETAPGAPGTASKTPIWQKWQVLVPLALLLFLSGGYIWLRQAVRPSFLNVSLGNEYVPGVEEEGFHFQERDRLGQPFRWTDGHARLVIPIDKEKPPEAVAIRLQIFRPPQVRTARLRIRVNDRDLFNEVIPLWQWERTFDLTSIDLGEELVLEIISDTFNPKGNRRGDGRGVSDDDRALGVQVMGIKLLRKEGKPRGEVGRPRRVSLLNVTLGSEFVPGVEESGWHFQEYSRGQP